MSHSYRKKLKTNTSFSFFFLSCCRWLESSTHKDILYHIDSYTLSRGQEASYDCLRLEEDKMKEKRVLLELSNNGCLPRYACVEMRKVTSSVMRFRLGNRVIWPLPSKDNMKLQICKEDNFRVRKGQPITIETSNQIIGK